MKRTCPICKTPTDSSVHAEFPFCSERCRQRDLGNWASEKYVVSEPVFDLDELDAGNVAQSKKTAEEDEDFKGFPKPDGTLH
ncbi:MAG TPA: DNA gyrase inhibitor YacG [Candidatus Acidoferrum sp.]|nr:DNA gyrase inhibitor YacG [Candidatus Acidoferrum sp.]